MRIQSIKGSAVLAAVLVFLSMTVLEVYAGDGKMDRYTKWEKRVAEIHRQLGLTPEQEQRLEEHRQRHRSRMHELYQEILAKKEEIREELRKQDFDMEKIRRIHNELKALKLAKEDHRLDGILEVRNILSAGQFSNFLQLKEDMKRR